MESVCLTDYYHTPERRLWLAVLLRMVDDLIVHVKDRNIAEGRQKRKPSKQNESIINYANKQIDELLLESRNNAIKTICDTLDMGHEWFQKRLETLANDKELIARPRIDSINWLELEYEST